jgi:glycosyltransferase involved in cell wall biosynthesis
MTKSVVIQGVRGIPAMHGGFETFAEYLSLYLVARGWRVTVYCQVNKDELRTKLYYEDNWNGVRRVFIPVRGDGAWSTIIFDFLSIMHIIKEGSKLVLTLGYNTAVFNLLFRIFGIVNLINMDGLEWKRSKWSIFHKIYLYINERLGCLVGSVLIADHPEIKRHLESRVDADKIIMIPYGARQATVKLDDLIFDLGLNSNRYVVLIARPEPENSILEIVLAFSRKRRGINLAVLGNFNSSNKYHASVKAAASSEVLFLGAIYEKKMLDSLRVNSLFYIHGHTVGGTNPSLVEALGAGQATIAHDNKFNRWVAGDSALYFRDVDDCAAIFDEIIFRTDLIEQMRELARHRFNQLFTWDIVLSQYEKLLSDQYAVIGN